MRVLKILAVIFLFAALIAKVSEGGEMNSAELKKLDDKELIKMAVELIGDDSFNPENMESSLVSRDPESVFVSFRMRYRYVPLNSKAYYEVGVDLLENLVSKETISNPEGFNLKGQASFFQPDDESRRITDIVREILGDGCQGDCNVEIREYEKYYQVYEIDTYFESYFKLEKDTWQVYDEGHADILIEDDDLEDADGK